MMWCRRVAQVTKHTSSPPRRLLCYEVTVGAACQRTHLSSSTGACYSAPFDKWSSIVTGDGQRRRSGPRDIFIKSVAFRVSGGLKSPNQTLEYPVQV